jgi:hypothetical protein
MSLLPDPTPDQIQAVVWKPTLIAEMVAFRNTFCKNCENCWDGEIGMDCQIETDLLEGKPSESITADHIGRPKCENFQEYE